MKKKIKNIENIKAKGHITANVERKEANFFGPAMTAIAALTRHAKDVADGIRESNAKRRSDRANGADNVR